ncbi:hypothetical protein QR680_016667 [Steinernema hermaphroditum]|uniref:Uncharacterized protein n=1 Tax=Steinernema hermaphroditum TaxID=289476 RepID=A0AA39LMY0_9BILA|nr:hypothetical protein QR680_016667 [Steinernema hermaphroditum]
MDIKYSIVAGFMVTLGVCVVIFIPSFVVVFDVTANKTEFVGTFDRSPFSFSFLMALKWSALLVLFLLVGICIMVFIPSAIVGYQEAQNKREFLSNFLATTSFGILLLIVAFLLGVFCTLKKTAFLPNFTIPNFSLLRSFLAQ